MEHSLGCPCNNADERGCFLISAKTNKCISCECEDDGKFMVMTHDPLCFSDDDEYNCRCDLIALVRADQDAKYVNPSCMWGQAECIANCPNCNLLDQLYADRVAGYKEGYNDALKKKECLHH